MRLALTLCLLLFSRALADTPLTIVEQGQSRARVGVHPEAGEWERRAAQRPSALYRGNERCPPAAH